MIYTSYYSRVRELVKNGIEPICISRGAPSGFTGRRIMSLAPTWQMLKMPDAEYNRCYEEILAKNDRDALVASFGGKDVALLCWEKDINECHRKRVGEWLREGGYEVEEFATKKEKEAEQRKAEKEQEERKVAAAMATFEQLSFV